MIINVKNVSMQYKISNKRKIMALKNISYSIDEGETIGLIGLNGAGKSSSIKLLTGIIKPTSGVIQVMNMDPFKKRKQICRKYGVMFGQRSQLWWDLPVKDSFYVNGSIYGLSKKEVDRKIEFYKNWIDMSFMDVPVRKLSLGQRVISDILVSMLHEPKILFLDEATIALDVVNRKNILDMISKINRELKTTLIITSHQLDDIESVCERILLLNKGELIYDGSVINFLKNSSVSKVISVQTTDIEQFRDDITYIEKQYGVLSMYKGTEASIFYNNEQNEYKNIANYLSSCESVETFNVRGITLEERIILMEG